MGANSLRARLRSAPLTECGSTRIAVPSGRTRLSFRPHVSLLSTVSIWKTLALVLMSLPIASMTPCIAERSGSMIDAPCPMTSALWCWLIERALPSPTATDFQPPFMLVQVTLT